MTTFNQHLHPDEQGGEHLNMESRLWDFIDGHSDAEEKLFIENLIATNAEWKSKYQELLDVHQLVNTHIELDEPSMRFTRNVMEEIGRFHIAPAAKSYINKKVIWGIAVFFFTMIFGFLIYGFGQVSWSDSTSQSLIPYDKLTSIDYSKFFNNTYTNIFLMVNIVLGLVLLDMYLGKKKKELSEKHS